MAKKQEIMVPGDFITTEEEYAAGANTFVEDGKVISAGVGSVTLNENTKEAQINGKKISQIRAGDVVQGQIMLVKENSATVQLLKAENGKRITGITVAQLPIRNVANSYVSKLREKIRIGDVIRAQVSESNELAMDLSTKGKGFGVINAYCTNCRKEMSFSNGKLMCLSCGSVEERKWFEQEDAEGERGYSREGGFEHRGGFRGRGFGGRERGFGRDNRFGGDRRGGFGGRRNYSNERPSFGERRSDNFGGNRDGGGFGMGRKPFRNNRPFSRERR